MRKLSADIVYPIHATPLEKGVVMVDDEGVIQDLLPADQAGEASEIEYHKGILCPGFVNTHCHLELSHLRGAINEKIGMAGFIYDLVSKRNKVTPEAIKVSIGKAETEMIQNGIVAVCDISNSDVSFHQKSLQHLHYHTCVELFDIIDEDVEMVIHKGRELLNQLHGSSGSLVPHAPYSVSEKLLNELNQCAYEEDGLISIHNQESIQESELFEGKENELTKLYTAYGVNEDFFRTTGFNSLRSTLVHLAKCNRILLVHNTYTSQEDIQWAHQYSNQLYWCFCPKANLYIEDKLPNVPAFVEEKARITIGTDSLASNDSLSILEEIKVIQQHYPSISLNDLLTWSTLNGAQFMGLNKSIGTLEKGKKPGVLLISGVKKEKLSDKSTVQVLV